MHKFYTRIKLYPGSKFWKDIYPYPCWICMNPFVEDPEQYKDSLSKVILKIFSNGFFVVFGLFNLQQKLRVKH